MLNHKNLDKKNRKAYKEKSLLRLIYKNYYKQILNQITIINKYPNIEIGSGGGNIKEVIPNCITTDQFIDNKIDQVENIYNLSFKNNSISNIILLDVFHHLEFPRLAINEMNRVLVKNGRIIMIEPAMGFIPKIIFKIFHEEPIGFNIKIKWDQLPEKIPDLNEYFAAQSLPWRAFVNKEFNINDSFNIKLVKLFSDFSYLASGGYSYPSFYPKLIYPLIKQIDNFLSILSKKIFSARMLVVLEKK
jgi:SAM-dependent methyltransferase